MRAKDDIIRHHKDDVLLALWENMLQHKPHKYPNLLHVVRILLVFPVSTSQVERQLSAIKRFLGYWRLSLKTSTIEMLLRIRTEGPSPVAFNAGMAVKKWWSSAVRRPGPQESSDDESEVEEIE